MKSLTQVLGDLFSLATLLLRVKFYIQTLWPRVCFSKNIFVLRATVLSFRAVKYTLCSIQNNSFLFPESKLQEKISVSPESSNVRHNMLKTYFWWVTEYYFNQEYLKGS